jgi:hypothetical protein
LALPQQRILDGQHLIEIVLASREVFSDRLAVVLSPFSAEIIFYQPVREFAGGFFVASIPAVLDAFRAARDAAFNSVG